MDGQPFLLPYLGAIGCWLAGCEQTKKDRLQTYQTYHIISHFGFPRVIGALTEDTGALLQLGLPGA